MMLRMARTGLTTPAVVGRGLSEGLGRTEATLNLWPHEQKLRNLDHQWNRVFMYVI